MVMRAKEATRAVGIVQRALERLDAPLETPAAAPTFQHDPRVLAAVGIGGFLKRELRDGTVVRAKVVADGYRYKGKLYDSPSAVAKVATGTDWDGYLFFRLKPYTLRGRRGVKIETVKEQYAEAAGRYALAAAGLRLAAIPPRLDELLEHSDPELARAAAQGIHGVADRLRHMAGVLELGANVVEARHGAMKGGK